MSKKSILTFVAGTLLGSIVSVLTTRFMLLYDFPKKTKRETKHRSYSLDDEDDRSYDNVHVKTEREAMKVKKQLQERIEETGYTSVANLYELTGNYHTWIDTEYGWTSLNSMTWYRTKNRERPWLLILPRPKYIRDLK